MVFEQCEAKWDPDVLKRLGCEMTVLELSLLRTTERSFKCKTIDDSIFFVAYYSSCAFLSFWYWKVAISKAEWIVLLGEHVREHSFLIFADNIKSVFIRASKHKHVLLSWMSMTINIKEYFSWVECFLKHLLRIENFRNRLLTWRNPFTIQIHTWQWTSIVPNNDAIRIQHWNDLEDKKISQLIWDFIIAEQELNHSFNDEASRCFSWMNSSCDDYTISRSDLILIS